MPGRRPDILEKRINEIKKKIVTAGPEGISQKMLRQELHIPRTTANRCCKLLEKEGKIRVLREGRGAKYIAKSKIVMDPEIGAYVQGRQAYFKIIRKRHYASITTPTLGIDIGRLTDLEIGLLNFSSIMGALLTYILLQAMSQGNPVLHREYHRKGPYYMNDRRKDQFVRRWIDGFLSGLLVSTPYKFRDLLYQITGHYPPNFKDRAKLFSVKKPGLFINNAEVVKRASEAFHNIYPSISNTLDRTSAQLPKAVEFQKASLEAFEERGSPGLYEALVEEAERNKAKRRSKQAHTHKFKLLEVKAGVKCFRCEICGRKRREPIVTP
jgi:hypothetical protein